MPLVTIIVPVLADTDVVGRLLAEIQPNPDVEVVVVDGGADERLQQIVAARPSVTLLRTAAGRGLQMNRGAAAASGGSVACFGNSDPAFDNSDPAFGLSLSGKAIGAVSGTRAAAFT